jgi:hypothetical protein
MRCIYSPQRRKERKGLFIFCFLVILLKNWRTGRPENKKNQLYKVNLMARGNYNCNISKTPIIFSKSALSFFAALPVRRYFWGINGKE